MERISDIEAYYRLYVNDLFTYALYFGFDKEIIMDAIHDVFYKLALDKEALGVVTNIKFYLFKSLKNRLYDIYKTRKQYIELSDLNTLPEMPFNINVTVEDTLINIENQRAIKNLIQDMLESLTERQREIIYLRYIQGYDYKQISSLLNIGENGCRKLVSKAISKLRDKYGILLLFFLFC